MASGQHRTKGAVLIKMPGQAEVEIRTFTCVHCNGFVMIPAGAAADQCGGFCGLCFAPICGACAKSGKCTPFEKRLEKIEARGRMLDSIKGD